VYELKMKTSFFVGKEELCLQAVSRQASREELRGDLGVSVVGPDDAMAGFEIGAGLDRCLRPEGRIGWFWGEASSGLDLRPGGRIGRFCPGQPQVTPHRVAVK
jgi:hypothetical protein